MYVDSQLVFTGPDGQAVTADAGSTDVIDLGVVRKIGVGRELYVVVNVLVAMTDTGSDSTATVTMETDEESDFGSPLAVFTIGTFAALSAVGTSIIARLPVAPANPFERFIRLKFTMANGNLTAGTFEGFLALDVQAFHPYPDGFTIS